MANQRSISWIWVVLGTCVIVALNKLIMSGLAATIVAAIQAEDMTSMWMYVALGTVVSYGLGGAFVGIVSPGETLKEPAIAAVIAAVLNGFSYYLITPKELELQGVIGVVIMAACGAVLGFGGAIIGEKIQGDNTDKMRERGELPPL